LFGAAAATAETANAEINIEYRIIIEILQPNCVPCFGSWWPYLGESW
jgi:hypothetical protein